CSTHAIRALASGNGAGIASKGQNERRKHDARNSLPSWRMARALIRLGYPLRPISNDGWPICARKSPRSYELYGESIANIVPHIGQVALSKLQPDAIAAMYATALERGGKRGEGLAPSSVKMMHRLLVQAFRQAVKWQLIARNPVDAVSAPRVEHRQMPSRYGGAAAYLAAARGHEVFVPIMLGVLCGLRRGEIAALRW